MLSINRKKNKRLIASELNALELLALSKPKLNSEGRCFVGITHENSYQLWAKH